MTKAKGPRFEASLTAVSQETKDALDGKLGIDLSFPVWFRQQPELTQRAILGDTRYALWRRGKLPLHAMISAATGNPLTIEQLQARSRRR